jgi:hypothetical protein
MSLQAGNPGYTTPPTRMWDAFDLLHSIPYRSVWGALDVPATLVYNGPTSSAGTTHPQHTLSSCYLDGQRAILYGSGWVSTSAAAST